MNYGSNVKERLLYTFRAFHFPDYRRLWTGNLATQLTLWMQVLALGWLGLELTDSPFFLGLLGFARTLPMFIFALFGGVLADRFDRRRLMLVCQVGLMLNAGSLAVLIAMDLVQNWHVLTNAFLFGTLMAINTPTRQALMANVVTRKGLMNAISLHFAAQSATRILGPYLAGRLIEVTGIAASFALQSVLYVWAIAFFLRMSPQPRVSSDTYDGMIQNVTDGLVYVKENRRVLSVMGLAALLSFAGMPYVELLPAFVRDILGVGPADLGTLLSAAGVGALIGTLGLASLAEVKRPGVLLLGIVIVFGALLTTLAASRWFYWALVLLVAIGAAAVLFRTISNTVLQTMVADRYRGRVMGIEILAGGFTPFGSLAMGMLASIASIPIAFGIGGVICVLCGLSIAATKNRFGNVT